MNCVKIGFLLLYWIVILFLSIMCQRSIFVSSHKKMYIPTLSMKIVLIITIMRVLYFFLLLCTRFIASKPNMACFSLSPSDQDDWFNLTTNEIIALASLRFFHECPFPIFPLLWVVCVMHIFDRTHALEKSIQTLSRSPNMDDEETQNEILGLF